MWVFAGNEHPTVGCEQEFHLVDPLTADLVPAIDEVRRQLAGPLAESVVHELFQCMLELRSIVASSVDEMMDRLAGQRLELAEACRRVGVRLAAAGSHPFASADDQPIVPNDHYRWVQSKHGLPAFRQLSFGLHVHVGMRSGDAAVYALNEMRRWVGPLLGFSANSPFHEGRDTQLASARWHWFNTLPRTGLPPRMESFRRLEDMYDKFRQAGDVTRPGDLWWAVRPQPRLGTLEMRIFDLPTRLERVGMLAAICQAACAYYQDAFDAARPATPVVEEYLRQNCWKASRFGLSGRLVDPVDGQVLTAADQVKRMLDMLADKAAELGAGDWLDRARRAVDDETDADWQRRRSRDLGGDLDELELEIVKRTIGG